MSVWADIRRKSLGQEKRIEDKNNELVWPRVVKVQAQTIAADLIPVQPMAPPMGITFLPPFR